MYAIRSYYVYGYTVFWHHNLPADIAVFFVSIAGGQLLSMYILGKGRLKSSGFVYAGIIGLLLMTA